jgi:hypothetical protein
LTGGGYVSFGEDVNGEIYVVNISGTIYHLEEATVDSTPSATATSLPTATPTVAITPTAYNYLPIVEHEN